MIVVPQSFEDLWALKKLINVGDIVSASSTRVFETDSGNKDRKRVTIALNVETIELSEHQNVLRLAGKIVGGFPEEYIQIGKYHSFNHQLNEELRIKKENWSNFDIQKIKEMVKKTGKAKVTILLMDDKIASLYLLTDFGVKLGATFENSASKRDPKGMKEKTNKFFSEVLDVIEKMQIEKIIVAGPGFTNDYFCNFCKEKNPSFAKKIHLENCNTTEISGITELMKKGAISNAVGEMEIEKSTNAMEKFLEALGKDNGFAVYGEKEINEAIISGALDTLIINDEFIRKSANGRELLESAEKQKLNLVVVTSETMPGKQLEKFGGVAGIRRYAMRN